ncbi:MAG: hypothetical protein KIT73_05705, partial [Burkholderiales bacterium]|nr:hypothetical protein [Burkholderiales bacterium]
MRPSRAVAGAPMEASSSSFPDAVWQSEVERIRRRREVLPNDYTNTDATPVSPAQTAGLALSGGGIRSATFCLGVLQHLARDDGALARRLDYLSTVSGGGYIGGLYGSLFLPEAHRQGGSGDDAQAFRIAAQAGYRALATDGTPASAFSAPQSDPQASTPSSGGEADDGWRRAWTPSRCLLWLRSNGRYLAPRGTGDIVFASALAIRNWVALHVVIGAALLAGLLIFATVRAQLFAHAAHWRAVESWFIPVTGDHLYWSTGWTFVGTVFVLLVLPPGLAYWLFHERDDDKNRLSPWPLVFHLATLVAAGALIV